MGIGKGKKPFALGKRETEILRHVHFYRYMTALDVCHLMYAPSSLNRVRSPLAELSGGGDFIGTQYLYRFRLAGAEMGTHRVYTLGGKGRNFLESERWVPSAWYFRPEKMRHLSFGYIMHSLTLTRFLVACRRWAAISGGEYTVADTRISYDLAGTPGSVTLRTGEKREALPVIPDGWIVIEREGPEGRICYPLLLEIDRGTMYRRRFKEHIASRIEFVRGGGYEKLFGTRAVLIVYATAGERMAEVEARRRSIAIWTMEVLEEIGLVRSGGSFRFLALPYGKMYEELPFGKPVWYVPGSERAGLLFEG